MRRSTRQAHRNEVHLTRTPDLRALVKLPPDVEEDEYDDVDVVREEVGRIPLEEDLEAVDENEENGPEETPVGQPWLQDGVINKLCAVKTLSLVAGI